MSRSGKQPQIAAIVLAAGASARMGAHKLLLPLEGKPLLAWSVVAVSASSARPIILALGRDAASVMSALQPGPYTTIVNQRFEQGMGTTLALAVAAVPDEVAGTIITLGDQPFMSTSAIEAILAAARAQPERIAMGAIGQHQGHPVYLPRRVFADIAQLVGDEGARSIIARERADVTAVALDDVYAQFDVDTPEEYRLAQEIAGTRAHFSENTAS